MGEVLKALIPKDVHNIPTAFETVGTIAHLNLKPYTLPYKYIIG